MGDRGDRQLPVDEFIKQSTKGKPISDAAELIEFATANGEDTAPIQPLVKWGDLAAYSDQALEGRLAYYEREALFERHPIRRADFQREANRTKAAINARKAKAAAGARQVFR